MSPLKNFIGASLTALTTLTLCACASTGAVQTQTANVPTVVKSPIPDAGPQTTPQKNGPASEDQNAKNNIANSPYSSGEPGGAQGGGQGGAQGSGPEIFENLSAFNELNLWQSSNPVPALNALRRSCSLWAKRDSERWLKQSRPEYGQYKDWEQACFTADYTADNASAARQFFQTYFSPVRLSTAFNTDGLLTGYYEPEISVRRRVDNVYSEAILGEPYSASDKRKPRSQITSAIAPVLAYGKPIDVFFMQVQGSGRLRFEDGEITRAAFAAHNGRPYSSIGKVLVERGEMTLEQASKQSIEAWMNKHSLTQVRELMNKNARYVFFQKEQIENGAGPNGAMALPLTAMGSMAIDPSFHPYGALVWLETTLPQTGGDYKGAPSGLLVSMQDTGGAIKGPMRGDLFFGSGDLAGDKAGVMKHRARWTLFLPTALAMRYLALHEQKKTNG